MTYPITLAEAYSPGSVHPVTLVRSGVESLLTPGTDYAEVNPAAGDINMILAVFTDDKLVIEYQSASCLRDQMGLGGGATQAAVFFADHEVPAGAIDGVNTTFTLARTPNPAGSLHLFKNALRMVAGTNYTLSGLTITYTVAPTGGDTHVADYRYTA